MSLKVDRSFPELDLTSTYSVHPEMEVVYKTFTGIEDDAELKEHILKVREEAFEVTHYRYLRMLTFTKMSPTEIPHYDDVIKLGSQRTGAIFVEIGTGLGNDIRKIMYDGYPVENIIATDISAYLWNLGHTLFGTDPTTFPVKFIQGDIFDEAFLSANGPQSSHIPELKSLNSLTPLKGHVSVIFVNQIFHLFARDKQAELAHRLAQLLSSTPGSMILGRNSGVAAPAPITVQLSNLIGGGHALLPTLEGWEKMWSEVFPQGSVEFQTVFKDLPEDVAARLRANKRSDLSQYMHWSIKVL